MIASLELVLLVAAGVFVLAKPLEHLIRQHAQTTAAKPAAVKPAHARPAVTHHVVAPGKPRPRNHVKIMVFNGNGLAGSAGDAANRLRGLGYLITGTANARRQDYATTVVMYSPGFRTEAERLARDLGVKVVGPLDGIRKRALDGGQLAVIMGA